jgi:hypothetical protein
VVGDDLVNQVLIALQVLKGDAHCVQELGNSLQDKI